MQCKSVENYINTLLGIRMEPDCILIIAEWPKPMSHCDIWVFVSFANFYYHFISAFLRIAKPMMVMLEGGKSSKLLGPIASTPAWWQSFEKSYEMFMLAPL